MNELIQAMSALLASIPIFLAWLFVFAVLERLFPATDHKSYRGWMFNGAASVLYIAVGTLAGAAGIFIGEKVKDYIHGALIDLRIGNTQGIAGAVAATMLSLFVFDFFYYWWHRSQHKYPALWAIHKLHHMDEGINVSTNLRHNWLEDLGRIPTIVIPMALLFNLSPGAGGVVGFLFSAWTFFIHANLRLNLGRLSWILAGPQLHRIHHSKLPQHFDRNFAAFFPIWDVLFRTYHHPSRNEFPPTGIHDERGVDTFFDAVVLPFRTWRKMFHDWRGNRALSSKRSGAAEKKCE
jgi:sterol desaturase/sphingolipid hydroxylase (fatty acid hydroxylase superfamily)